MPTFLLSGLSGSLGVITETTVGTEATVNAWYEINDGTTFEEEATILDSESIQAGLAVQRGSQSAVAGYSVSGTVNMEVRDKGFSALGGKGLGFWLKHALGSTAVPIVIGASTAWRQSHIPGSHSGLSFTTQLGLPDAGVIRAHTYRGCKITEWEISCDDGGDLMAKFTIDGWKESTATALATPAYAAAAYQSTPFTFADAATFTLGGTATTTTGVTSIAGGTPITTVVKGFSLKGTTPMATERRGLGNAGVKREQFENGQWTYEGHLDAEYTSRTEIYDLFKSYTSTPLQLDFAHGDAGTSNPYRFSIILPQVKFQKAAPTLNGPDLVTQAIDFKAYHDGSTNPAVQLQLVSQDQSI
jgi:hypothetical protein